MIDTLLRDVIKQQIHDNEVAVLLSGGVDSLSVGFAAEDILGKKVHAYSFHLTPFKYKEKDPYTKTINNNVIIYMIAT